MIVFQCSTYGTDYIVNILYNIIVPKADYLAARGLEGLRSFFIIFHLFEMLASIQFNDEFLIRDQSLLSAGLAFL